MTRYRKATLAATLLLVACSGDGPGLGNAPVRLTLAPLSGVATAGAPLSPAVQVTARDVGGDTATSFAGSVTIALAASPGGATLSGTTTVNAVAGVATFANLMLDRSGTGYTLTATAGSLKGDTSGVITVGPGPVSQTRSTVTATPATIPASSGGSVATITVTVRDAFGNSIPGSNVVLAVSGSGNTVTQPAAPTGAAGVATGAISSTVAEAKTVSATVGAVVVTQTASVTVSPGNASQLAFTTQPANTVAGTVIAPAVVVSAQDAFGNLATTFAGAISVAIAANPALGMLTGTATNPASNGAATFSDLSIDKAGTGYTLQATASPALGTATSTPFVIATGVPAKLAFVVQPTSTTGGATIAPAVTVRILDAGGNLTSSTANVTLAITSGSGPTGAHLSGGSSVTVAAVGGVATFSGLSIDSAGTNYTLTATSAGLTSAVSTSFNITVGGAAGLAFGQQPTTATGGATISPAVTVRILDAGGNLTSSTANVTLAIPSGAGTAGAHLSGGTSVTAAAIGGVAIFGSLSIDSVGTNYTLRATSGTLAAATSSPFNISGGPAAQLGFEVQPANAASGATITPAIQVEVRDAGGNRVTSASHGITLVIQSNPSGGTLSGTTNVTAANGLATFSTLSIDKAGIDYTLQATASPALTAATSTQFDITAGSADHLAFFVQPSDEAAGAVITPSVQVEIQDAAGNRVTSDTRNVTVAILDNPSGGTLSGPAMVNASSGMATFSSLSVDKAGTGYTLQATASPALPSAVSVDFNIAPAAANRVSFFVEPSSTTAGTSISPAIQVEILDAFGNRVGTATNSVTVALLANPGGGALSGGKTHNASAGVATFNNLSINKAASGYTLRVSATGVTTQDTSVLFTITPGAATQLVFTTPPSNTAAGATMSPVVVTARDNLGNTATGFTGNVTVAIGTDAGGGMLSGTTSVAAVSGVATFSDLSIDKIGTGYTLTASATGPATTTSGTFNITVSAAAKLAFGQQPVSTTGGDTIAPAVTVRVLDANGNLTSSNASVSLGLTSGTGTAGAHLVGTVSVAAIAGVATFGDLSLDSAGTAYTLNATSSGLAGDTSSAFNVTVGAATRLDFLVQPSTTPPGATITPAVQVEVRDAGGNLVTTDNTTSVTVAIGTNPASGTLGGTKIQTAAGGVAIFSNLSINNAGSGYTLTAAASGLTGAASNGFDIVVGTATQIAFGIHPSNATGGATISPAVTVEIRDAGNNIVTNATNSVTLAFGTNPKNGHLSGTKTVAAVNGIATFDDLSVDSAATGYTLSATSSGLSNATSAMFDVTVGPATKLGFRVQPVNTAGGTAITPAVQVEVRDAGGNRIAGATNSISVAIGTNPNDGTLSGTTTIPAVAGVATFSTLKIDSAGTGYRLAATAAGLTDATSSTFNITVGSASQLGFLVGPSDATAGSAIAPPVKVEIRDAGGNRVTSATTSVTVAIGTNPGGGTLGGTMTQSAVSGVATFSNLTINKSGIGYTVQASGGGFTPVASGAFDITADGVSGSLSSLVSATDTIAQCSFSCVAGIHASAVTVTVKDQFGNLVGGSPVVLSASGIGNDFTPSASGNTDSVGVFTAAFNSSVAEGKTISATAGGIGIAQTGATAVMPVLVGAGDIADCNSVRDDATANQLDSIPGVVFAAGDNAYPHGTATNFTNCYDPTWGRHRARTKPVIGNHEYDSSSTAAPHIAYFGAAAADPLSNGFGYYSFELGTWHVVVLNSDSGVTSPASGQLAWLQSDLVGRTNQCVLAIWHRPLFTSGSSNGGSSRIRKLWQALEDVGAEIVINGHDHLYERFAPQDSLGNATAAGIREFIVGTGGGETHSNYVNNPPNVEASDGPTSATFSRGVLRLTFYANSYRWEFLHAQGQGTYSDSGTAACH